MNKVQGNNSQISKKAEIILIIIIVINYCMYVL